VETMESTFAGTKSFGELPLAWCAQASPKEATRYFSLCLGVGELTRGPATSDIFRGCGFTNRSLIDDVELWCNHRKKAILLYGPIDTWNTSSVTDMSSLFEGRRHFNDPIGSWDVSGVTDMHRMFFGAWSFRQALDAWNVERVVDMELFFDSSVKTMRQLQKWRYNPSANKWRMI
jgi:hypothetical protein